MSGYCLDYKNDKESHLCTIDYCKDVKNMIPGHQYSETIFETMEELLEYALNMKEDVEIPEGYKVTKLYSILFTTANFDPKSRKYSTTDSSIIFTSKDETFIDEIFKKYVEEKEKSVKESSKHYDIGEQFPRKNKTWFCWHTEDYAYNQIIHAYSKRESYLIEEENNKS